MITYPVNPDDRFDFWDTAKSELVGVNRKWPRADGMEIQGLAPNLILLLRVMADNPVYDPTTQRIGAYGPPVIDLVAQTSTYTREVIELTQTELDDRADNLRAELWNSFNEYAENQTDSNSRTSINLIATDTDSTSQQLQRAREWGLWWKNLWYVYAVKRATLQATGVLPETDFATEVGTAPWTIWEIAE